MLMERGYDAVNERLRECRKVDAKHVWQLHDEVDSNRTRTALLRRHTVSVTPDEAAALSRHWRGQTSR